MWRLAPHELWGQRRLTALISFGLVLAALAYVSLLGTASGTTAVLTGDIGSAWHTPYDLLVRPEGDVTRLESTSGLVSPNFISSISGGISGAQLKSIRLVKYVTVAAPIALVGYTTIDYYFSIPDLTALLDSSPVTALRLDGTAVADDGMARYPVAPTYYVFAPRGVLDIESSSSEQLTYSGKTISCDGFNVICEVGTTGTVVCSSCAGSTAFPYAAGLTIPIPVMVAGVDPTAEAQIAGLKSTMLKGSFLPPGEPPIENTAEGARIPLIVSSQSFISEIVDMKASLDTNAAAVMSGNSLSALTGWSPASHYSASVQSMYSKTIVHDRVLPSDLANVVIPGEIHFRELSPTHLQALTVPTDVKELLNPNCLNCEQVDTPPDASDTWYRQLEVSSRVGSNYLFGFKVLGEYDPAKIPGFNVLAGGNLSAYAPPEAILSDGRRLAPSRNVAGFITSPPLMLTTLAGAQYFAGSYTNGLGPDFISAIRVRVSGTAEPSDAAQARLTAVARAIEQRTGLRVSLVKGSSPLPIRVNLAKGKFGTPALTVTEFWGKEDAAIDFLRGVTSESLVLFLLTIGVVLVLLGVVGQLAARRRRPDFALLRAIGWPLAAIVRLALIEMAGLGAVIGVATSLIAIGVTRSLDPAIPTLPLLAVAPLLVALSVLAPLPALLGAARSPAAVTLQRGGPIGKLQVRSVQSLAVRDLLGPWRVESLLCVGAAAVGSGLVGGVILVLRGFAGTLGPTTLGRYLASQVGPLDTLMIGIAIVAGAGAAATLVALAYLERQVEFSTLRAIGWPRRTVAKVIALQAIALGGGGGLVAAVVVAAAGLALRSPHLTLVLAPVAAILVALATAAIATSGTIALAYRLVPAAALRESA